MRKAAAISLILGELKKGITYLDRAVKLDLRALNNNGLNEDYVLLGFTWLRLNDLERSEQYLFKSFEGAKAVNQRSVIARAYLLKGLLAFENQDFLSMEEPIKSSLSLFKELEDKESEAEVVTELAHCTIINNDWIKGRDLAEQAVNLARNNNLRRRLAFSLIARGDANRRMGEWDEAMKSFREAESIFPPNLDAYELAALKNRIGFYYLAYNDPDLASTYFEQSITLFQQIGEHGAVSELSSILGEIHFSLSRYDIAKVYFNKARIYADESKDKTALGLYNLKLGKMELQLGRFEKSKVYLRSSLHQYEKVGSNFFRKAEVEQLFGEILELKSQLGQARKQYVKALELNKKIRNKFAQAENYYHLARVDLLLGDFKSSIENINESIELTNNVQGKTDNNRLRAGFLADIFERYKLLTYLLMKENRFGNPAHGIYALRENERSKSRVFLEMLRSSQSGFFADADSFIIKREKELRLKLNVQSDYLTNLLSQNSGDSKISAIEVEINDLENQLEEIKAELKQSSPIYSAIKNPVPFDVADFQREVLDEASVLLEFSLGKEESYLWAVDKADVTAYYLPPRAAIETRVEKLRGLLGARQLKLGEAFEEYQRRLADAEIEYKLEARILSNDLLGQAKDKLAGKKLIVVADGRLHYFPLGSLPMPGAESDDPILLTNEVVYEPSASALKIFRMEKKAEAKPQKDLLVFADPVFSKSDERIAGLDTSNSGFVSTILSTFRSIESLESMPRLPASREEAKSISDVVGANQTTVRSGFAANRDGVLNGGIEDYKILHFATHGLIDERRPELSGILLSLFNESGKQNDGGFIRLQDVYGLKLKSDLVVLSACDTGIGKEIKGEGVMSLNNAFLQAGAKSVVSSLWKVDDTATKDLMTEFYRGMADDNLTAAAALRQAQIKMYNDPRYRSPFYWAAFTASGDTGVKVAFASNARLYGLIAAAIVFAAVLAFVALRRRSRRPKFPAQ